MYASALCQRELRKAQHKDLGARVLELYRRLGIDARAFKGLDNAPAETLVNDG